MFSFKTDTIVGQLKSALDFYSARSSMIASNVSNVDTPGYKAVDIKFEDILQSMKTEGKSLEMSTTDSNHVGGGILDKNPEIVKTKTAGTRVDGNNVDMDREMAKMAQTQIMYSSAVQSLKKNIDGLRYAIEEGKRG